MKIRKSKIKTIKIKIKIKAKMILVQKFVVFVSKKRLPTQLYLVDIKNIVRSALYKYFNKDNAIFVKKK